MIASSHCSTSQPRQIKLFKLGWNLQDYLSLSSYYQILFTDFLWNANLSTDKITLRFGVAISKSDMEDSQDGSGLSWVYTLLISVANSNLLLNICAIMVIKKIFIAPKETGQLLNNAGAVNIDHKHQYYRVRMWCLYKTQGILPLMDILLFGECGAGWKSAIVRGLKFP